jgi:hypothetical protein
MGVLKPTQVDFCCCSVSSLCWCKWQAMASVEFISHHEPRRSFFILVVADFIADIVDCWDALADWRFSGGASERD